MRLNSNLIGLCATGFLTRASYSLARTPVLALFAASLGAGPEAIGFTVAASTITGILFKMPSGVASDVIGRGRMLLAGLAIFAFVPLAYIWVSSYQALIVVRFFHGFATAIYGPVMMATIVTIAGEKRAEIMSWFSSIAIVGNLIGAPLGGLLLTRLSGGGESQLGHFQVIYGVVAALGMMSLLIGLWVNMRLNETPKPIEGKSTLRAVLNHFFKSVREILTDRRILLTSNMEGVQNLSVGAMEAFMPIYVVIVLGYSELQAGLLWGIQILITIVVKPFMGKISDQHGRQPLLYWGMFACAIPFALIPWVHDYRVLLLLAALFGSGEATVTSSAAALVADFCEEGNVGSAMGVFGTLFDVGHASGPILAGILIGISGGHDYRVSFAVISVILIISAVVFKIFVREK